MKRLVLLCPALLLLAACHHGPDANQANFSAAVKTYLAKRGDLCLAKNTWPIDVSAAEGTSGSRNALQMPVLEKLGLVVSSAALADRNTDNGTVTEQVRRYQLTDAGKRYYLTRAPRKAPSGDRFLDAGADLCAVKLSLDKVQGWEATPDGGMLVSYTYQVAPAPWTADADVRRVFPVVDSVIRGAGTTQLKEAFIAGADGWEAKDL